jgi:hypothetical protein
MFGKISQRRAQKSCWAIASTAHPLPLPARSTSSHTYTYTRVEVSLTLDSVTQLILPESFKLFPVYALALMKTKALKGEGRAYFTCWPDADERRYVTLKGGPVASDVRTYYMRAIKSFGVATTVELLYPRMIPIHAFTDDVGKPGPYGRIVFPPLMRTSYARMESHGAYLIGAPLFFVCGFDPVLWAHTRPLGAFREWGDWNHLARERRAAADPVRPLRSRDRRRARHSNGELKLCVPKQRVSCLTDQNATTTQDFPATSPDPTIRTAACCRPSHRVGTQRSQASHPHRSPRPRRVRGRVQQHARRGSKQRRVVLRRLPVFVSHSFPFHPSRMGNRHRRVD